MYSTDTAQAIARKEEEIARLDKEIAQLRRDCTHVPAADAPEDVDRSYEPSLGMTRRCRGCGLVVDLSYSRVRGSVHVETQYRIAELLSPSPTRDLLAEIAAAVRIFNSEIEWEAKYDQIFERAPRVRELCREAGQDIDYYDPDTSYEEDVRAYVQALLELKERLGRTR